MPKTNHQGDGRLYCYALRPGKLNSDTYVRVSGYYYSVWKL